MINEKGVMTQLVTEKQQVLTRNLHTVLEVHRIFNLHKCAWMAQESGLYSEEIVR